MRGECRHDVVGRDVGRIFGRQATPWVRWPAELVARTGGPATASTMRDLGESAVNSFEDSHPSGWLADLGVASSPRQRELPFALIVAFVLIHAPLALVMSANPSIATVHALVTIGAALWLLVNAKSPLPVVSAACYIAGAEVLWRETGAAIPWETGKYMVLIMFLGCLLRFVGTLHNISVTFLALLIPACVVPLVTEGLGGAREDIAFNLAGPVALGVGALVCSQLAATWRSLQSALWAFVAPVLGIAAIAANGVRSLGAADFFNDSNDAASGGFGPNQVSAVLGLAALFLIFLSLRDPRFSIQAFASALACLLVVQALLTFSRGGVLNLVVALVLAIPHFLIRRDTAGRILALLLMVALIGTYSVLPRLEQFTGGTLETRFTQTKQQESRVTLAKLDFRTFTLNPLLGVGVGQAPEFREDLKGLAAHTEYTRLLAEHGLLGVSALICLLLLSFQAYRRQPAMWGRAWTAALVAWTAIQMTHGATRLAAAPLAFSLAMIKVIDDKPEDEATSEPMINPGNRRGMRQSIEGSS